MKSLAKLLKQKPKPHSYTRKMWKHIVDYANADWAEEGATWSSCEKVYQHGSMAYGHLCDSTCLFQMMGLAPSSRRIAMLSAQARARTLVSRTHLNILTGFAALRWLSAPDKHPQLASESIEFLRENAWA